VTLVTGDVREKRFPAEAGSVIWKRRTIGSRDVFRCFSATIMEVRGSARQAVFVVRPISLSATTATRCGRAVPLSGGSDRPRGPTGTCASVFAPTSSAICAAAAGITAARWPAPIRRRRRRRRRLNFRPLHIVMISTLIDGARVGGATLEINLRRPEMRPAQSPRLGAMCRVRCNPDFPRI